MHDSMGPSKSTSQTVSRSVQPFLQGDSDRPTDRFVPVLFAFVLQGFVLSVLCQEIEWEESLRNDPFVLSGM